ncbi:polyprenol phosphomannose-dependent alpha 1,6 mannosyltransferase MptB [Mycolicibacterium fluoranthenivorans]|jgi:alpha-1,6-mannosyltransferase|uniref:Alpha-1,6-mannosyltransferase n=1 Tax=Mycolicibacterium fluoranthenivorans TaxID=258505 RepID=A0A1G4WD65_9MYCO|nr:MULTISPECIES: polyprenol phosphomannose-dependent alpha 1,6 mannosyltransferase MptB [Mycobacteriaceae]MCV7256554.1 polyprenol phosphomannose-dependent alpha 1,6 mannosyltransferase MptB [Mycobacterium hackensackense]QNJ90308.1 polyprenol phosphomannose-dependent alpha 1,6 mannosyltransferase MptB [Mycolicibacterium fluoranthenivorans]SCX20696.1 alpha-1,6-mannosyltransferase [Mycolicibacterium fluoranthenivorans]
MTALGSFSSAVARWHADERTVGSPLNDAEVASLRRTRVFGATGTVLMAIGALGAGARPVVQDPTFGVRLLNLPSRIQTVSLTMTTTGAVMMTLAWLMLGRFALGPHRMSRSQLDRTLLLWALPLLIAPPMYSRDVYSYLAQSQIARIGLDPYKVGPAPGLGLDHVFTLSVPTIWRETPAPYGPLFLWIGRGISTVTGENIVAAVLCHRLVVLLGVGLIVWATPRLARRCGVTEVGALWLGPCNPLLFMHLVAGIHNEAPMLGLMLAGTEFALRGIDGVRDGSWRLAPRPLGMLVFGTVLIALSSQVKLPSLLAIGFVAMALAWRWGGTVKSFLAAGFSLGALSLLVMAVIGWASGLGFGWLSTLGTANVVRSWMSPPTLIALGTGQVGILLGLGDHTTAVLGLTRGIGVIIIGILVTWLLLAVFRGRLHPVGGLGVALGATVLLFPVVQPWYLLWAIIPLATWATRPGFRGSTIAITLVVGIFGPTANGDRFALFQIVDAVLASAVIVVLLIALTWRRLPWRVMPDDGVLRPAAYAESP